MTEARRKDGREKKMKRSGELERSLRVVSSVRKAPVLMNRDTTVTRGTARRTGRSRSAALPNAGYVGTYTNDYVGGIDVVEVNGVLTLLLGPQQQAFPLRHYDRDVFLYYPVPESPDVPGVANFTVAADQQATQVVIEGLNGGTFTRMSATEETP